MKTIAPASVTKDSAASSASAAVPFPTADFLDSIGVNTTYPDRGQPVEKTVEMLRYGGWRWIRGGIEGVTDDGPTTFQTFVDLHKAAGVRLSICLGSGGSDIGRTLALGLVLAREGALLAFEGSNEPNNWGIVYQGEKGGGRDCDSWLAVGRLHRDFYAAVKRTPGLENIPVWSISETGGMVDNVGLQFLEIPGGSGCLMPAGTRFADFLNVHNYIYHPNAPKVEDNKAWDAADPTPACRVDGLWGNHGHLWYKGHKGYSPEELVEVPRVTTESGMTIGGDVTERVHAAELADFYLAQFKRGWSFTCPYILRDRTDEGGNQRFGFFSPDYKPRLAARFIHNLTTVLADTGRATDLTPLEYSIPDCPATTHDLLLRHSSGAYQLVVWGERVSGRDAVRVMFGAPRDVEVFDIAAGTEPVSKYGGVTEVPVETTDHPLVLILRN